MQTQQHKVAGGGSSVRRAVVSHARQLRSQAEWERAWRGVRNVMGVGLAVVLLDAALVLPAPVRLVALLGILLALGWGVWRLWRWRVAPVRDAELAGAVEQIESHAGVARGTVAAAMRLDERMEADALRASLRERAVAKACDACVRAWAEAGRTWGLRQASCGLWVAVVAWAVVGLMHPGLVGSGLMRLAMPWGDWPVYALTELDVVVDPGVVREGEDAWVGVRVRGRAVEQAWLVESDGAGQRWVMQREAGDHEANDGFVHRLRRLSEPVEVHVEAGRARSRVVRIVPQPPERADAVQEQSVAHLEQMQSDATDREAAEADGDAEIMAQALALLDQLGLTWQEAKAVAGGEGSLAELIEQLAALEATYTALSESIASYGTSGDWDDLFTALLESGALEQAQARPVAGGDPAAWAAGLAQAIRADHDRISQTLAQAMSGQHALDDAQVDDGDGDGDGGGGGDGQAQGENHELADDLLARGSYDEQLLLDGREQELMQAIGQRVPEAYRERVFRYLQRIGDLN